MSKIKFPVQADDGRAIIDFEGSTILVANVHFNHIIPEAAHKLNGYETAMEALRDIVKHLEAIIPKSTLLVPVGIIARRTLKQLGELDEQEDK